MKPIRIDSSTRTILVRPGVGAAGHVVQRSDRTTHRVVVEHATLILVEEGTKRVRASNATCVASAGQALSVQAGEVVDISNTPGPSGAYRALWMCWFPDQISSSPKAQGASPRVALHTALDGDFGASFYRALDGLRGAGGPPTRIATSRLQEVLLWLGERGFHFVKPGPRSIAQRVRHIVSSDPSVPWSMEAVARKTATSVPTLRRKLEAEGTVFRDLVQDVRMSHALSLLENSDVGVLHVATAVGYASPSRFTARFRERFGYLPSDIRGHHRGREAPRATRRAL